MPNIYAGSDIVELGIEIEKNGKDFYTTLAGNIDDEKAKKLFIYLAEQEQKHIGIFVKILDSVSKYQPSEAYSQEYFAYMNALASDYVFTQKNKGKELARDIKTKEAALSLGIYFEKDSILFYEGMKIVVPGKDHNILDRLIIEEKSHLQQLFYLKKEYE